uniref:Uncharacterized protein TCIL3000_5_3400 n=1 Tax=Trypanosoma congolense (strain IL3000) TaxID=1068625 RepID=G0ULV0_TRYCI|nr:unnamed protein product [Trypanosoma congolense IL3000]
MAKKKSRRGVESREIGNFQYSFQAATTSPSRSSTQSRRSATDAVALKHAYMLHNFQFVLRHDVYDLPSTPGLPQQQQLMKEVLRWNSTVPPWAVITAVVARGLPDEFQCPICLEAPEAARITSCGHVFCLICMLQYVSRLKAEGKQCVCPVCNNLVTFNTLRRCIVRIVGRPSVGARASFTMLKRKGDSCILLRQDDQRWAEPLPDNAEPRIPQYGEPSATYSRYVLGTEELEATLRDDDYLSIAKQLSSFDEKARPLTWFDSDLLQTTQKALELVHQSPTLKQQQQVTSRFSPPLAPKVPEVEKEIVFEFYGESEGQPYYMHPITYKMLCVDAEARNLSLDAVVEAPVEEITMFTQDETTRKRYRVFSHVPLHAVAKLCLLDLSEIVLPSTMKAFAQSLAKVRKARQRRESNGHSSVEDLWHEYVRRYCTGWRSEAEKTSDDVSPTSEFMMSELSADFERLPVLELPPAEGTPLRSGPQPVRGSDNQSRSCWSSGNSLKLFVSTPPQRPIVPTWGGHAFNPHKPSASGSSGEGRKQ